MIRFYIHVVTDIIVVGCLMWAIFYAISGCATTGPKEVWPVVIVCPEPERVIGQSATEGWTERDDAQVEISRKRCQDKFGMGTCLKTLTKVGVGRYTAVCKKY